MDKMNIIDDIESEYKKLYLECKKRFHTTREGIENSLKILANLKTLSSQMLEIELKNSIEQLLKPIIHATVETKHTKLFVSCLAIVKKLVTFSLIKQNHTGIVIQILKDILDNSSEEFIQIKVLETLLPMINPQTIHLSETLVNNVLIMCLKIFTFKSPVFKNPVSVLFKQLMMTTFGFLDSFMKPIIEKKLKELEEGEKLKNEQINIEIIHQDEKESITIEKEENKNPDEDENVYEREMDINNPERMIETKDMNENNTEKHMNFNDIGKKDMIDIEEFTSFDIYITSLSVFKNLILISEGNKKEWISSSIYSKCLGLELLAGVISQCGWVLKNLPEFIDLISKNLHNLIQNYFESATDYIMGLKLCRVSIEIIHNIGICYNLIPYFLKYAEASSLSWQKQLGVECLLSILSNSRVISDLYKKNKFYDDIINSLSKISYSVITNKASKNVDNPKKFSKLIEMSNIVTESDNVVPPFNSFQLQRLIYECYSSLKESYIVILENNQLKLGIVNKEFNNEQILYREMIFNNYENIKNAMTALLINSNDEGMSQNYLILFQSFINLYGSVDFPQARDSYLNDLCKLAIPNNLENSLELKEKNMLIAKTLFNIAHCVNIIDSNSWLLILETMQKIYLMLINSNNHMLKPNEEFEIDVIIKNLESTIKKFNPEFGQDERSVLRKSILEDRISIQEDPKTDRLEGGSINEGKISVVGQPTITSDENTNVREKKGIFTSLKNAFGFNQKTNSNSKKLIEENIDLQILSTAIDSLYISSYTYDDNTILHIFKALYESCCNLIESNPHMTDNICTYLHFNLAKMLEISVINVKRIDIFWGLIVNIVKYVCLKNITNISRFSLDCLTIINLYIITQYKCNEDNNLWNSENWQSTILFPFKTIGNTDISQHINLNIIYNLSKILQNCGQYLDINGWNSFIEICQALIDKSDEIQCDNTFKLIEQIMSEYLDYLSCSNCLPLINILEAFALYKKNHNISFSAITMLWNVASIIEKFQKLSKLDDENLYVNKIYLYLSESQKNFFSTKSDSLEYYNNYFNELWKDFFSRLVNINKDVRFDVRKAAINIYADIYVAKNFLIDNTISFIILNKFFLEILDSSYFIFEEKLKLNRTKKNVTIDPSNQLKTPKFSDNIGEIKIGDFKIDQLKLPEKKIKFDEEPLSNNTSNDEKEYEETNILIIQSIGKVLKSFLILNKQANDFEIYRESLIFPLRNIYTRIMKMTSPEVAGSVLKSIQEIYSANNELFLYYFEILWQIYNEMGIFITTDFFLSNLCTMATSSKMVYNTLELLKEIFLKEINFTVKPDLINGKNLENVFNFVKMLLKSTKHSEGIQVITNPQRLLSDEKIIFEFVEKLSKFLDGYESWKIYCSFLSTYVKYDLNDNHSEAHCRKVLEIYENFFCTKKIKARFVKYALSKLISEIKEICLLRNKNDYVMVLIKNNKSQLQLWQFASNQIIKILFCVICGGNKEENENNYSSNFNPEFVEFDEETTDLNEVWEAIINCYETIFRQSETGYKTISRNVIEELLKSCQEMEIQIINFIVNGLLPNSLKIPKEMQIKLLILLDIGSNFDYNLFNLSSQSSSTSSSISRVCISNLFELCKYRSEESLRKEVSINQDDYVKIKVKIAKMSTPILIKRCKETLKKFLDDEIKSGAMPLARSRLEDIKYVLDKLKNLEIYPNYLNFDGNEISNENITMMDIIMKNKKSHMFHLLPLLSEFITTKENDIKLIIKDIFRSITSEIGIK